MNEKETEIFKKYIKLLAGQKIYPPIHNISMLVEGAGWNRDKYFRKFYENPEPHPMFILFKEGEGIAVLPYNLLYTIARQTFCKYWKYPDLLKEIDEYYQKNSLIVDKAYKKLSYDYIANTSSEELLKELKDIQEVAFYAHTRVLFSAIFDEDLCKKWLEEIGDNYDSEELNIIWTKGTIPVEDSFDKRRLRIYLELKNSDMPEKEILEACQFFPVGHSKVSNLDEIKKYLEKTYSYSKDDSERILYGIKDNRSKRERELKELINGLSDKGKKLVNYIQFIIDKRDVRKDLMGKYFTIVFRISQKVFKEAGLPEKYIFSIACDDLSKGVEFLKKNSEKIIKRYGGYSSLIDLDGKAEYEIGTFDEGKKLIEELYLKQELGKNSDSEIIYGKAGSPGKITGIVKVVRNINTDGGKLMPGDILVTGMTRPDFIPLMKKAAAFVTDEGGITCHAAIVGREMKKPVVIGTKIATNVLHDGDYVEVDANMGIVKIIKKA